MSSTNVVFSMFQAVGPEPVDSSGSRDLGWVGPTPQPPPGVQPSDGRPHRGAQLTPTPGSPVSTTERKV